MSDVRISIRRLPHTASKCDIPKACVYRKDGVCDEPQINKANGDSACHRMNNKDVLAVLTRTV